MREAHPLVKRVSETLDLGSDDDLFGHAGDTAHNARRQATTQATPAASADMELSFGEALRGLLGSTTSGSTR